jgi:WD40 repeat protein
MWIPPGHHLAQAALSRDGTRVATTGLYLPQYPNTPQTREVSLWQVGQVGLGRKEVVFAAPLSEAKGSASVHHLAFSPCGTRLATAHGDGTVKIWSLKQLLGKARPSR